MRSNLDAGARVALLGAIRDIQLACERIGRALESHDKVVEWGNLKAAYEDVQRVEPALASVLFQFIHK